MEPGKRDWACWGQVEISNRTVRVTSTEDTRAERGHIPERTETTHWFVLGLNEPTKNKHTPHCPTAYTKSIYKNSQLNFCIKTIITSRSVWPGPVAKGLGEESGF